MSGIKISKPGIPVETAQPKDLVFSSEFNAMKVATELTGNVSTQTVTIPHGQATVPVHLVYIKGPYGIASSQCWLLVPMGTPNGGIFYSADADQTNIYIRRSAAPTAPYDSYRVFVFADPTR